MNVLILQPMLKYYRVELFKQLNTLLAENNDNLRVVLGSPWHEERIREDNAHIITDYFFYEKSYWLFSHKVHFLTNACRHIAWADIIITEQANKHFFNYILLLLSFLRIKKFAYWGHGINRQGNPNSISERLKQFFILKADWWFAYTKSVATYVTDCGYSKNKITVLDNSIDTNELRLAIDRLSNDDLLTFKRTHHLPDNAVIGLFCGSLHDNKNIDFLLDAAVLINQYCPHFRLILGGKGKHEPMINRYAEKYSFIIYLNRLHGKNKYLAFKCADFFLNPGMVGLAILDAFTAGLPLFTTNISYHSPEVDYLQHGYNGMMSEMDLANYSNMVISVIDSPTALAELKINASTTSYHYSIENMSANFYHGIQAFSKN